MSDEKSDLEEQYFSTRTKFRACQLTMDEAIAKADHVNSLLESLQKSKQSEMSDRMIEMSTMLQSIRLSEMRSNRAATELKENNTYLSRLLRNLNDQVRKLEEKAAEFESKLHKREEEFRKADNERMRRFFNARFDDIPGAFSDQEASVRFGRQSGPFSGRSEARPLSSGRVKELSNTEKQVQMYQEPDYIARQKPVVQDSKFLEGKVKRLEVELSNALEQIRHKESVINTLKGWQLADKFMDEEHVLKEMVDHQRTKVTQVHEQEAKEMAEAAAQMVKTLQEMMDQKNEQLRARDDMIDKLRGQMMQQREQDALEIARLQQQMSLSAGTTLSKLQQIVISSENAG